jgi:hypothetical protein
MEYRAPRNGDSRPGDSIGSPQASTPRPTGLQPMHRPTGRATERIQRAVRTALWWCRDVIGFGTTATTRDGTRILLICTACRRVRNAAGDWAPLAETWWSRPYVLSHGYCPFCFEQEYSQFPAGHRFVARRDSANRLGQPAGTENRPTSRAQRDGAAAAGAPANDPEARHD